MMMMKSCFMIQYIMIICQLLFISTRLTDVSFCLFVVFPAGILQPPFYHKSNPK